METNLSSSEGGAGGDAAEERLLLETTAAQFFPMALFPGTGSLLNGRAFPGAWKLGQGSVVQQEIGCLGSQGPVCSLHLGQFLSEEPGLKALRTSSPLPTLEVLECLQKM